MGVAGRAAIRSQTSADAPVVAVASHHACDANAVVILPSASPVMMHVDTRGQLERSRKVGKRAIRQPHWPAAMTMSCQVKPVPRGS